jgi:hypothetical protein
MEFDRIRLPRALRVGLLGMLLAPLIVVAQQDFSKVEIRTTPLGQGIAMLAGAGGNLGVCVGPDGVLVIDDQSKDGKKIFLHNSNNAPQFTNRWEWRITGTDALLVNFMYSATYNIIDGDNIFLVILDYIM